jgi:hypothetical protein
MIGARWAAIVLIAPACTVPELDLDGRPCPCATGYVCDTSRNACVRPAAASDGGRDSGRDASRGSDAGGRDAGESDGGPPPECVFMDDFEDGALDGWQIGGGTWGVVAGEAVQSDPMNGFAFMTAPGSIDLDDVRVRARVRQNPGSRADGALEIDFRVDPEDPNYQYHCNFEPNTPAMRLMRVGNDDNVFLDQRVLRDSTPPFDAVTLVVEIRGSSFHCCVEEIAESDLAATESSYPRGSIGLKTWMMSGSFDCFEICPLAE